MPYGTLKVDNITYTAGGSDASTTVSGLVNGAGFVNLSITGTISGATITGNTGQFTTITAVTGIFTTTLSGATVTGNTGQFTNLTGTSAGFTTVTGQTVTGTAGQFGTITGNTAGFTTVTGTTVTGETGSFTTVTGQNVNDNKGNVRAIPQNSQGSTYTLVTGDAGKHIFAVNTITVPSGVFAVGDAISIYNNTAGNITISGAAGITLRQAGTANTGNRTLAQRGLATILCVSGTTDFVINGGGLT